MKIRRKMAALLIISMLITSQSVSVMASSNGLVEEDVLLVDTSDSQTDTIITADDPEDEDGVILGSEDGDAVISDAINEEEENIISVPDDDVLIVSDDTVIQDMVSENSAVSSYAIDSVIDDDMSGGEAGGYKRVKYTPTSSLDVDDNGVLFLVHGELGDYTDITIPTKGKTNNVALKKIPNNIFRGNSQIVNVKFENDGSENIEIAEGAFERCTKLKRFTAPEKNLTTISSNTFRDCTSLESLDLYDVEIIGRSAFENCTKLGMDDDKISGGNKVKTIEAYAFKNTGFTRLNIGEQLCKEAHEKGQEITLDIGAFYGCTNLKSISICKEVKKIKTDCFRNCTGITSIYIQAGANGTGVVEVGDAAFSGCTALTELTDSFNAQKIGANAFNGCTSLQTVILPISVTEIGSNAFGACQKVTMIKIGYHNEYGVADDGITIAEDAFPSPIPSQATMQGYGGTVEEYALKHNFKKFETLADKYEIKVDSEFAKYFTVTTNAKGSLAYSGAKVRITIKPKKDNKERAYRLIRDKLRADSTTFTFISGDEKSQVFEFIMPARKITINADKPYYYTDNQISDKYTESIVKYSADIGNHYIGGNGNWTVAKPGYKGRLYFKDNSKGYNIGQWMFTYSSSNSSVVDVTTTGVLTSMKKGEATITAKSRVNGKTYTVNIKVGGENNISKLMILPVETARVKLVRNPDNTPKTVRRIIDDKPVDCTIAEIKQSNVTAAQSFDVILNATEDGDEESFFVTAKWNCGNTSVATLSKASGNDNRNTVNVKKNVSGETYIRAISGGLSGYMILRITDITPRVLQESLTVDIKSDDDTTGGTPFTILPYDGLTIDDDFPLSLWCGSSVASNVQYGGLEVVGNAINGYRLKIVKDGGDDILAAGKSKVYSGNKKIFIKGRYKEGTSTTPFVIPLEKVTITNSKLTLSAKLTGNINLFYNKSCYEPQNVKEHEAELARKDNELIADYNDRYIAATIGTLSVTNNIAKSSAEVTGAELWSEDHYKRRPGQKPAASPEWKPTDEDAFSDNFSIERIAGTQNFRIKGNYAETPKTEKVNGKDVPVTSGYLVVYFKGFSKPLYQKVKLPTKNTAPKYVMSVSSTTENQNNNREETQKAVFNFKVFNNSKDKKPVLTSTSCTKNNNLVLDQNSSYSEFFDKVEWNKTDTDQKDTVKITASTKIASGDKKAVVKIRKDNWSYPVSYTYTVKYVDKAPKGKLSSSTVKINSAYTPNPISAETILELNEPNCIMESLNNNDFNYAGKGNRPQITFNGRKNANNTVTITVTVNKNTMPAKGSYKFTFQPKYKYRTGTDTLRCDKMTLTVSVVNDQPAVKLSGATFTFNTNYPGLEEYVSTATYSNIPANVKPEDIVIETQCTATYVSGKPTTIKGKIKTAIESGIEPGYDANTKKNYLKFKMNPSNVNEAYSLTYEISGIVITDNAGTFAAVIKPFRITVKGTTAEAKVKFSTSGTINPTDYTTFIKCKPSFTNLHNPLLSDVAFTVIESSTKEECTDLTVEREKADSYVALVKAVHPNPKKDLKGSYSVAIRCNFKNKPNLAVTSSTITIKPSQKVASIKSSISKGVFRAGAKPANRIITTTITKTSQLKTHIRGMKIKDTNSFEVRNAFVVIYNNRDGGNDEMPPYASLRSTTKELVAGDVTIKCVAPELLVTGKTYNLVLEAVFDGQNYKKDKDGNYVDKNGKPTTDVNKMVTTGGSTVTIPVVVYK